jgi:hypothetical protein
MKQQFSTVEQIHGALDQGLTVYWTNTAYKVYRTADAMPHITAKHEGRQFSLRNGMLLEVRCIENYFGGILNPSDVSALFVQSETKPRTGGACE